MMVSVTACISQLKWIRFKTTRSGRRLAEFSTIDSASRGITGSVKLLFSGARPQLAFIGAIITTLALAFDTFSQQVIVIKWANRNITEPADVPAINQYGQLVKEVEEVGFYAPLSTRAAMYSAIYNPSGIAVPLINAPRETAPGQSLRL